MATTKKAENLNVLQRLHNVMRDIGPLTTDAKNNFQKYSYVSEQKITVNVQAALVEHGVLVYPFDEEITIERGEKAILCTVKVKYRCCNIDDPADFIEIIGSGSDIDKTGAHLAKAKTMAYKQAWRQLFAIACGDDFEKKRTSNLLDKEAEVEVEPETEDIF